MQNRLNSLQRAVPVAIRQSFYHILPKILSKHGIKSFRKIQDPIFEQIQKLCEKINFKDDIVKKLFAMKETLLQQLNQRLSQIDCQFEIQAQFNIPIAATTLRRRKNSQSYQQETSIKMHGQQLELAKKKRLDQFRKNVKISKSSVELIKHCEIEFQSKQIICNKPKNTHLIMSENSASRSQLRQKILNQDQQLQECISVPSIENESGSLIPIFVSNHPNVARNAQGVNKQISHPQQVYQELKQYEFRSENQKSLEQSKFEEDQSIYGKNMSEVDLINSAKEEIGNIIQDVFNLDENQIELKKLFYRLTKNYEEKLEHLQSKLMTQLTLIEDDLKIQSKKITKEKNKNMKVQKQLNISVESIEAPLKETILKVQQLFQISDLLSSYIKTQERLKIHGKLPLTPDYKLPKRCASRMSFDHYENGKNAVLVKLEAMLGKNVQKFGSHRAQSSCVFKEKMTKRRRDGDTKSFVFKSRLRQLL